MEIVFTAGQKSGWVYKLNAETGKIAWKSQVGNGGILGGVHFGMTSDGKNLYVPYLIEKQIEIMIKMAVYAVELEKGDILWKYP